MARKAKPIALDTVALLSPRRREKLARGQVGTIVELLNRDTALVEFADDKGVPYAITACPLDDLIVLRSQPQTA